MSSSYYKLVNRQETVQRELRDLEEMDKKGRKREPYKLYRPSHPYSLISFCFQYFFQTIKIK